MSAPAFAWALERGATLDLVPADRLVLIYLADMANGEKVCWPSQGRIEMYTGLSPNTVRSSLHRLSDMLLIRVEIRPGYTSRYHILRDTPASTGGNGVHPPPPNRAQPSPQSVPTPPSQNVPIHPPQTVATHPRKSRQGGGHDLRLPPPNRAHDPSNTQEKKTLDARRAREPKPEDFKVCEEEGGASPTPMPPLKAPALAATNGGGDARSSDAYLDDPSPDDALPKAEADPLDEPADKEAVAATAARAIAELTQRLRMRAYGLGRPPPFTRNEQIDVLEDKPATKPAYLTGTVLQAARDRLAARRAGIQGPPP